MSKFNAGIGGVVRRMFHFRKMSIRSFSMGSTVEDVECLWFDRKNQLHRQWFNGKKLVIVSK